MAYAILPDFETSALDASKNGQELCNELKRLYDHLMTAVAAQSFKWDLVEYSYLSSGDPEYVRFSKGSIKILKRYYYSSEILTKKIVFISGVPPVVKTWQYVFAQSYEYDAAENLISITNQEP